MKIYLDNCALGRLTDDLTQDSIRSEATAVRRILESVDERKHQWIASDMLLAEIARNKDATKRLYIEFMVRRASSIYPVTPAIVKQAATASQYGLHFADAVHLFAASETGCDKLITTDTRFIRQATRHPKIAPRFVQNPTDFIGQM